MATPADVDAAAALLADGPLGDLELLTALGFDEGDEHDVLAFLRTLHDDGRIAFLADGRVVLRAALVEGLVVWHRVSAAEVDERAIELGDAVLLLVGVLRELDPVLVDGDLVGLHEPRDADGEPDHDRGPLVDLPEGWCPDLAAGDLVGFRAESGRPELVSGPPEPAEADAGAALVAAVEGLVADHAVAVLGLGDAPDGDSLTGAALVASGAWSLHLDEVGSRLLADHGGVLRALDLPVAEVLAEAGLRVEDGTVLGPQVDAEAWAVHALGRDLILASFPDHEVEPGQAERAGMAWAALHSEEGPTPEALAGLLADPVVAEAVAGRIEAGDDDEVTVIAALLEDAAGPGPALVRSRALVVLGRVVEAKEVAERSLVATAEGWEAGVELLALLRAAEGDLPGAIATYRGLGETGVVERLQQWLPTPPSGVGRNEPCPCGSGRKFKQCCLIHPPRASLADRVPFLWWKLQMTTVELFGADLPTLADPQASARLGMVAVDALLLEDGAIVDVARLLGPLLPDDERDLLTAWGVPRRTVHEVIAADKSGYGLRDLVEGGEVRVGAGGVAHAHPGDLLLGVTVDGGDGTAQVVGPVAHLPAVARDEVVAALAAGPDAQGVVAMVEALTASGADAHVH